MKITPFGAVTRRSLIVREQIQLLLTLLLLLLLLLELVRLKRRRLLLLRLREEGSALRWREEGDALRLRRLLMSLWGREWIERRHCWMNRRRIESRVCLSPARILESRERYSKPLQSGGNWYLMALFHVSNKLEGSFANKEITNEL